MIGEGSPQGNLEAPTSNFEKIKSGRFTGEVQLSDGIKIWAYNPYPVKDYTQFTIWHPGTTGQWNYYKYDFKRDKVSNYSCMNEDHEMANVWRKLDEDDIEFIESVLNTKLPNCYIGNLLIKQCRDLWKNKHPRKENL